MQVTWWEKWWTWAAFPDKCWYLKGDGALICIIYEHSTQSTFLEGASSIFDFDEIMLGNIYFLLEIFGDGL